jgi:hypothetical protein
MVGLGSQEHDPPLLGMPRAQLRRSLAPSPDELARLRAQPGGSASVRRDRAPGRSPGVAHGKRIILPASSGNGPLRPSDARTGALSPIRKHFRLTPRNSHCPVELW